MNSHISGSVVLFLSCGERALSVSHAMMTKREDDTARAQTPQKETSYVTRNNTPPFSVVVPSGTTRKVNNVQRRAYNA